MAKNEEQEDKPKTQSFSENDLNEKERADFKFVKERILQLQLTRQNHYGHNLDSLWADADKDYIPHRLGTTGKRIIATDEEKGWRGNMVTLGGSNWQSDISQANPFVKIQIALSILIDQNPTGVFSPLLKKFQATTELMKQLYQRSWEFAKSKPQLKLFVFNLAKYGWACARTYPLRIERKAKVLVEYNPENPEKSVYEDKTVVDYNDIFRENLDPRNVWIDDMAKPNNPFSVKDWCWRKVYDMDVVKEEFGKYKLWDKVSKQNSGLTSETIGASGSATGGAVSGGATKEFKTKDLVEVYFYENRLKDIFMVLVGGVPIVIEPLPIADAKGRKKLSLWQTYWNLRHAESPYGVGIYEAMRYDQAMLDRIRNMTIDQLTLSIYKMFFYQGTQQLQNTGEINIRPGVGTQVLDPKNINFLEIPPPGKDAYVGIEMLKKDVDEDSGITDPLMGIVTGKTAFEVAQAKESALKRLKNPLENILEALNDEAYITISLVQLIYSIPETYEITDQTLIDDYLQEVESDPDLYSREDEEDEEGNVVSSKFIANVFPEFPLNLDKDEKGNLIETKDTRFFRIKPRFLTWEGIINVKAQSILSPSKQLDKALDLEFYNMFIPLLTQLDQERMITLQSGQSPDFDNLPHGKAAKSLAKLYDKDPRDVLPDAWLQEGGGVSQEQSMAEQPLFAPQGGQSQSPQQIPQKAEKSVGQTSLPERPQGVAQKLLSSVSNLFRR